MCLGWVRTDMGGPNAQRSVGEGADSAVWLAAEAPHELTGKSFRDRREIPWLARGPGRAVRDGPVRHRAMST